MPPLKKKENKKKLYFPSASITFNKAMSYVDFYWTYAAIISNDCCYYFVIDFCAIIDVYYFPFKGSSMLPNVLKWIVYWARANSAQLSTYARGRWSIMMRCKLMKRNVWFNEEIQWRCTSRYIFLYKSCKITKNTIIIKNSNKIIF